MRVLALEPYHGGSHRAFLDGWIGCSAHTWTVLGLEPRKWKWRMRHAAITFAGQVKARCGRGEAWDCVFTSDMLNLAEFRGLAPAAVRDLPAVVYFHENQLLYPVQQEDERDYHYVMNNLMAALAADAAWFNSAFHRDAFLEALPVFLKKMPDHRPLEAVDLIRQRSAVRYPGIAAASPAERPADRLFTILWAARWEHDKDPETFFEALRQLRAGGVAFRISVIGEQFRDRPAVFDMARKEFDREIVRWGFQESREAYTAALQEADCIVSTARHEFFGISVVEAAAAGCIPVLPDRLAYPELFGPADSEGASAVFYDGSAAALTDTLRQMIAGSLPAGALRTAARNRAHTFTWELLAPRYDAELEETARSCRA